MFIMVSIAFSQEAENQSNTERPKFGIGLSFDRNLPASILSDYWNFPIITPLAYSMIHVSIQITPRLRIEPEIGYYIKSDVVRETNGSSYTSESQKFSLVQLGTSAYYIKNFDKTEFYYGAALGLIKINQENRNVSHNPPGIPDQVHKDTWRRTDFYFGPIFGAQYYFSKHFSLGGEVRLVYTIEGEPKEDFGGTGGDNTKSESSKSNTDAKLFIRWFF